MTISEAQSKIDNNLYLHHENEELKLSTTIRCLKIRFFETTNKICQLDAMGFLWLSRSFVNRTQLDFDWPIDGNNATLGGFDKIKHKGTREHFGLHVQLDKLLLTTPGRANYSYLMYYANCECPISIWPSYISSCERNNFKINVSCWRRYGQNCTASELTWTFNIPSSILQGNWGGRVIFNGFICFEQQTLQKSVSGLVFLLAVETHRTITHQNHIRSAWAAGKQQKRQHSRRVSKSYSQNVSRIGFSSKIVVFLCKPL